MTAKKHSWLQEAEIWMFWIFVTCSLYNPRLNQPKNYLLKIYDQKALTTLHKSRVNQLSFLSRFIVEKERLTIKNITDKDKGTYTCVANTTLDSASASAVLTVVGKT